MRNLVHDLYQFHSEKSKNTKDKMKFFFSYSSYFFLLKTPYIFPYLFPYIFPISFPIFLPISFPIFFPIYFPIFFPISSKVVCVHLFGKCLVTYHFIREKMFCKKLHTLSLLFFIIINYFAKKKDYFCKKKNWVASCSYQNIAWVSVLIHQDGNVWA